jgi:hypothetical protein
VRENGRMAQYPRMDPYIGARYEQGIDAKIVVMGNTGQSSADTIFNMNIQHFSTGVGKTSLLHRYVQNRFDPKNITSTTGAFFVTKKVFIDGLKVRLQLWDTAGQERFRSMVILYISLALPCVSAYSCLFRHLCIIEEQMRPFFCMTLPIFPPLMTFEAG